MITKIEENKFGLFITVTAENPKEAAMLLRGSRNAKSQPVQIYTSFGGDEIYTSIAVYKRKASTHINSISNK